MTTDEANDRDASVVRHEQELVIEKSDVPVGSLIARKHVDSYQVDETYPREVEEGSVERVPPDEQDSGEVETLPDGSVSIPVFEEELVITKRRIVRERIIVRKNVRVDHHRVETDLLRERVEIDADPSLLVDPPGDDSRSG